MESPGLLHCHGWVRDPSLRNQFYNNLSFKGSDSFNFLDIISKIGKSLASKHFLLSSSIDFLRDNENWDSSTIKQF